MNILFIVFMSVGALMIIGSFLLPKEEEESGFAIGLANEPEVKEDFKEDFSVRTEPAKNVSTKNVDAIEAAKKKAREAVEKDYKFDLHLTDSSNRTVEELERDLLSGLDLDENKPAESTAPAQAKTNSSNSGKSSNKKNSKKKNNQKNDRYDDLQFTDGSDGVVNEAVAEAVSVAEAATQNTNTTVKETVKTTTPDNKPKNQSSKNGGKKGKKK